MSGGSGSPIRGESQARARGSAASDRGFGSAFDAAEADLLPPWSPPPSFDEYQLIEFIGRGGMGEVYLAHDKILERPVAVKFISGIEPDAMARERFLVEARAAARLQHPNVVTIYRVGELDDRPFLISEFIRGKTLDVLEKPMPPARALALALGLARGLAAAHRRGVLHRDIKPSNAIVTEDGEVKLLDFGLAKLLDGAVLTEDARFSAQRSSSRPPPSARKFPSIPPLPLASPVDHGTLPSARSSSPEEPRRSSFDGLTDAGTLLGTPDYLPPEIWRGDVASRRSDVYSLGALIFELCVGHTPHRDVPVAALQHLIQRRDAPRLADVMPGIDARLSAVIERCLQRDPDDRFASGEELREALEQIELDSRRPPIPEGNPYRGLHTFEAEHRALFFGRRAEIGAVIERLRSDAIVLVAGDSGVGKSSLCRAGVLPAVEEGVLADGRVWSVVRLVPGRRPLAALAAALAPRLEVDEETLARTLTSEPGSLARSLRRQQGDDRGLVIFLDQLEELVTMGDPGETAIVGEALGPLAAGGAGVRLLMTVRSDFLTRVASISGLGDEVSRALYLLRPLSVEGTRDAIVGPARAKGVGFESEALVNGLVAATATTAGSLPLLQFALAELWDARDSGQGAITAAALDAIGGVGGALARHGDDVLLGLPPPQRAAARRLLIALVTLEGTRARRTEDELARGDPVALAALSALVRGRLLVVREAAEQGATYELAHEALVKGWSTLARWLDQLADTRAVRLRLESAAIEWERLGRVREALWRTRQLAELGSAVDEDLGAREAAFLEASHRSVRRAKRLRNAFLVAAPLALAGAYGGVRLHAQHDLDQRVNELVVDAGARRDAAHRADSAAAARRRDAFARFDALDHERGEALWAEARKLTDEADLGYGGAIQALETTLMLDARRVDVQGLLGDVLYERALLAEEAHHPAQRDELVLRLALYDPGGDRRRRWIAPARVDVDSVPPGAHVAVFRASPTSPSSERPADNLLKIRDFGAAPIRGLTLEPGSYLLTLALEGRAPVRYPVLLGRGEELRLTIRLPLVEQVPEGFVYVPAGRFLFGSTADEELRTFLNTAPVHPVETGAYLIARNETTYADWIAYLRDLDPTERARRTPKIAGLLGALALEEAPGGQWQLRIQPRTRAYAARSGEMIHYESRQRHVVQDWLRFPVSGISLDDAEAYAAWLDKQGHVPGARLCDEHEWERAARGADGREFPHGDHLEPDDANIDATYGKQPLAFGPDEVGSHPASRSPFGLDDACGNVFEWTRSKLAAGENVLRGGAYYYHATAARSTNRLISEPSVRDLTIGIRLCASIPSE